jgi:seryl-tRNA synthetase
MIDLKLLRKERAIQEKRLKEKVPELDIEAVLLLDEQIRQKKTEVEQLKAKRNEVSDQIGLLKRQGKDTVSFLEEMTRVADSIKKIDGELLILEKELLDSHARIPNVPLEDVPYGKDAQENVCIYSWQEKPVFSFSTKNHLELSEKLNLFDFKRAAKLTGTGWPAYRGMGARLEWALIQYMIDYHVRNGYEQWIPPLVVKEEVMFQAGQLPKFANQQYKVMDGDQEYYLIPTAEVALNGVFAGEIFDEEELPKKCVAYTPCFRREAGAAGSQERGLIRMHQFNKVEMFAFTKPEESAATFEEFVHHAEKVVEGLGLHFRSMLLCTGDMSFAAAKTVDIEVWLPGQNRYYEVSSVSNCTDYQARRAETRFRRKGLKPELVHTLNGSGLATSRLLVALLENNQCEDGSIRIPKVLQPYLGGIEILTHATSRK